MCERSGGRASQKKAYTLDEQSTQASQWNSNKQSTIRHENSSGANGPLKMNGLIKKARVV
jgi:hypothetical protein